MTCDDATTTPSARQDLAIRVLDIVLSAGSLALTWPVLAVGAAGVKLSSPGPMIYRARRAGAGGEPFTMWKLRTMHTGASAESRITGSNDHRIFPWGRQLRRLKVDELPQLVNVLRGDMSLVGPRPEDVTIVRDHFDDLMRESLSIRPGITGPGALDFFADEEHLPESPHDAEDVYLDTLLRRKVALDLVYVRNRSVRYYVQLIVRTVLGIARIRRPFRQQQNREIGAAERYLNNDMSLITRAHV